MFSIDPLVLRVLRQTIRNDDADLSPSSSFHSFRHLGGSLVEVCRGLDVWRSALIKGRLPDEDDDAKSNTIRWPPQPLYDRLVRDTLVPLQLPRLVSRHPEVVPLVLMSLLQWTIEYSHRLERVQGDDVDAAAQQQDNDDLFAMAGGISNERRTKLCTR